MKILIGNVNTNNIDNLTWCLGFAGLAQMNKVVSDTVHEVNVEIKGLIAEEFGDMMLELYIYGFTVTITKE